jgi:hypothetical protein
MEDFLTRLRNNIVAFVAVILLIASAPVITLIVAITCALNSRPEPIYALALTLGGPMVCAFWYMFVASITRAARARLEYTPDRTGFRWAVGRLIGGWFLSQVWVVAVLLPVGLLWKSAQDVPSYILYPSLSLAIWAPVIINLSRHLLRKPRLEREWRQSQARAQEQRLLQERQKEREREEYDRERESITREYKELVEKFAKLFSDGSSPWDELIRTSNALNGTGKSTPFRDGVELYTTRIIKAFSVANGTTPVEMGRMFHILTVSGREEQACGGIPGNFARELTLKQFAELRRSPQKPWTMAKCVEESIRWIEEVDHTPPDVPNVVMALRAFDELRKTHLAADAADAYYSLVIRVSARCSASMAVDALRSKYLALLRPYISGDFNHDRESSYRKFNGNCAECKQYYPVLRIPEDANEEAIKNAYRNFVKIYHPDRFEGKSERQAAEGEMKQLNVAYKHIMTHFEFVKA